MIEETYERVSMPRGVTMVDPATGRRVSVQMGESTARRVATDPAAAAELAELVEAMARQLPTGARE